MPESLHKEKNQPPTDTAAPNADPPLRYASDPSPEQAANLPTLELSRPDPSGDYADRCKQALLLAEEAFAKTGSWVIFFREILGVEGVVRQLFPDDQERAEFIDGPEHATLREMLAAIRSQDQSKSDSAEPERMITIRIPRSLHDLLREESEGCELSINKLCITKLLQPVDPRFIPEQQGRRRGRRPGPQGTRPRQDASGGARQTREAHATTWSRTTGNGQTTHGQNS
ncbi:hypothetical protein FYK55_10885 [Roseiconus nitratireducens]|uniref:HicB family protein n=1 Tax=Roseiconus nitratireducens TaxID=2605748 RepID=A0A5M6D818_9BACT|nr:hypothetical protein [Roseiconus nitratireducens]KAA5543694.1 hypothetical protein FYK55_10885 [Roseiconus nitratireducens]